MLPLVRPRTRNRLQACRCVALRKLAPWRGLKFIAGALGTSTFAPQQCDQSSRPAGQQPPSALAELAPDLGVVPDCDNPPRQQGLRVIARPAASIVLCALDFIFSRTTCQRLFHPIVAEMRDEINADLHEGRLWRARWASVRGYGELMLAVIFHCTCFFVKRLSAAWKLIG